MSKKGYLTAAEYKTIRQFLGFSQQEAAEFHNVQNVRTIKRWENGDSWVSELACDKITKLLKQIQWTIGQAVERYRELPHAQETSVVLITYPDNCLAKFVPNWGNLPASVHRAIIAHTYTALKELGADVGIVVFNPQDYFTYLAAHNLSDGQDSRSAWACDYRSRLMLN